MSINYRANIYFEFSDNSNSLKSITVHLFNLSNAACPYLDSLPIHGHGAHAYIRSRTRGLRSFNSLAYTCKSYLLKKVVHLFSKSEMFRMETLPLSLS